MIDVESLTQTLPDPDAARRFLAEFNERHRPSFAKLQVKEALLSDVLTLVSYSPLLASTLLQNPEYILWLERERKNPGVRAKEDLLESLARFSLTNSQIEPHVLLARFRRRELLRIFLSDIRRLATIAETTEYISNLADAILEYALRIARQELENRYGSPLETDEKGRSKAAEFCIGALGKLGSKELNYSSDIDLLFIYSADGRTSESGARGSVANREYFVKLAETIVRLVGQQVGEGAAYRVDLRLRPHGRVGPLALSLSEMVQYYHKEARSWERQVLIRSRASAGDASLFKRFFAQVEDTVFSTRESVAQALENVRSSKQKIDLNRRPTPGFDVKLDRGGIREIEFIAQALQLAYGGSDNWLRAPHTLISLARLADRRLLSEHELTALFDAYDFLRRLEHILQMENGLQTHLLPEDPARRRLIAARMRCETLEVFEEQLGRHAKNVTDIFARVFGRAGVEPHPEPLPISSQQPNKILPNEKGDTQTESPSGCSLDGLFARSPRFADFLRQHTEAISRSLQGSTTNSLEFAPILLNAVTRAHEFGSKLSALRKSWRGLLAEIIAADLAASITLREAKTRQTALAEAGVQAAIEITRTEMQTRHDQHIPNIPLAVLGLGKLGGGGIDYDSDLDVVFVHGAAPDGLDVTPAEFFGRVAELFVNILSGVTRDGSLYRVDLRLRPYGKHGTPVIARQAFAEYMRDAAAIWELLAYVKLRAVGGDLKLALAVESETRSLIHEKAACLSPGEIARETMRIRSQLEKERSRTRRSTEVDFKYGPGGMLDVYFGMRFLQLRDRIPDEPENRSTGFMLSRLRDAGSLSNEEYRCMSEGYEFLSRLDHAIRLTIGRTTRLPAANHHAISLISAQMNLSSPKDLIENLTIHRLNIRNAFESVMATAL